MREIIFQMEKDIHAYVEVYLFWEKNWKRNYVMGVIICG